MNAVAMAAEQKVNTLTPVVFWVTLIAGSLCLLAGIVFVALEYALKFQTAKKAAAGGQAIDPNKPVEQGLNDTVDAVSKLATALKDLDMGSRTLVISVWFFLVAAVAAGLDSLAAAIAK